MSSPCVSEAESVLLRNTLRPLALAVKVKRGVVTRSQMGFARGYWAQWRARGR